MPRKYSDPRSVCECGHTYWEQHNTALGMPWHGKCDEHDCECAQFVFAGYVRIRYADYSVHPVKA